MAQSNWILFLESDCCWISQITPGQAVGEPTRLTGSDTREDGSQSRWGESVVDYLTSQGYAGGPVLLGIESVRCLVSNVSPPADSPQNHSTLSYALEVNLPLAAEDFVADFVFSQETALAIALDLSAVLPFVEALEDGGVAIQIITPTALLAVQDLIPDSDRAGRPRIVLWRFHDQIEFFVVDRNTTIRQWHLLPNEIDAVLRQLQVCCLKHDTPPSLMACNLDSEMLIALRQQHPADIEEHDEKGYLDSAAEAGAEALARRRAPAIELRRGALAGRDVYRPIRGLLRFTQWSAAVFLLVTIVVSTVRSYHYNRQVSNYQADQMLLFQDVLPGQRSVTGIRKRLESEYKKLSGLTGAASASPGAVSALETLASLLRSLPDDLAFRFQEVRLEEAGHVFLRGQVQTHGGADALAAALRAGEFNVQQPTSTQVSDRVVTISLAATAEDTGRRRLDGPP